MEKIAARELFAGIWTAAPEHLMIDAVATDSRAAGPGSVFVAIVGERVDGHDYARSAFASGADVLVATRPVPGVDPARTVLVADVLDAMIQMGANYRARYTPRVLGITGSVGKTTTKEFAAAVLAGFGSTVSTKGNQNNEIGVPGTLFRLDSGTEYAVVEMGMQCLGEIHKLTMAAKPEAAIITGIGLSHIEHLGTQENILRAKLEIADALPQGAPLVLPYRDDFLREAALPAGVRPVYVGLAGDDCAITVENIRFDNQGQSFVLKMRGGGSWPCTVPAPGAHLALDAALAFAAAVSMGLAPEKAAAGLSHYQAADMRQNIRFFRDICVIEDCYNASPDSMRAAMALIRDMEVPGRRIAVLGDMKELGYSAIREHEKLADECRRAKVDHLITVGALAAHIAAEAERYGLHADVYEANTEAAQRLKALAQPGDAVLVKASRGMHFEEILQIFYTE